MNHSTLTGFLEALRDQDSDAVWLRDRKGDHYAQWTWRDAHAEASAVAAWLERRHGSTRTNMAVLSRNRAHWILADLSIVASGNVTIPLFTTLPAPTADYILDFTDTKVLVIGEAENWDAVREILPDGIDLITLPGVDVDEPHTRWEDIVDENRGRRPEYRCRHDDLISIVFTSGTTGVPKGVMQTHDSFLLPMLRCRDFFTMRPRPRFFSYLPLSHIAERQLVMVQSLIYAGSITFNESLATLARDLADTRPNYFFGAPRVWEQLQQGIIAGFGSREALEKALSADPEGVGHGVRNRLGLDDTDYLLTAAAPMPPALIEWFERLGIHVMEGFGQTEIMAVAANTAGARRIGSIGQLLPDVEMKISDEGELVFRAAGAAIGYYRMPDKSAETFVDGWVHTGDKGYVDEDGFVYVTGRVKDYFKTIQGKFVAPTPIENRFSENELAEQVCLLGRGYSKTVIVIVPSGLALRRDRETVETAIREHVSAVNSEVDRHARIGAVIFAAEPWTIENEFMTPTMKLRREIIEARYGHRAAELAREGAEQRKLLIEWADGRE
jgi:long-chain acyl-CoA synthetase